MAAPARRVLPASMAGRSRGVENRFDAPAQPFGVFWPFEPQGLDKGEDRLRVDFVDWPRP